MSTKFPISSKEPSAHCTVDTVTACGQAVELDILHLARSIVTPS